MDVCIDLAAYLQQDIPFLAQNPEFDSEIENIFRE